MNPSDYYSLDTDAIAALPRAKALELLDRIRLDVTSATGAERARIVGAEVEEQAAAHGKHGSQRRAAEALGMKTSRVGQLWTEYKQDGVRRP
ncbi:hypothetical protein ABZ234_03580 [Nocardiopsis sp. NPDC006198]|uniref:hypothetical protein n=1 Tax=Nocardiopsis sp. NPDC006198 TaxID=3154472 RepID=UPI0033BF3F25